MKRIITCSDGTWNEPNKSLNGKPIRTNVQKIFDYILTRDDQGVQQIKFYDEGVGAEGNIITRLMQGATGKGIDENILDIYKFIVWNYEQGHDFQDEIYLFGFSRGAYTARSLCGLIRKCGILKRNDLNLFSQAYKLYRNRDAGPESEEARQFRKDNSYEVASIKFIGVWDTVGALGIPVNALQWFNKKKYSFYDTTLSSIIENAYHAVSIDEQRANFKPTLWQKSANLTHRNFEQVLEQKWFAGVHSNVGGGYPDEGLADIALQWIMEKAARTGLAFDEQRARGDVKPNPKGTLYNSRKGIFALTPGELRTISDGRVHDTVYERMKEVQEYKPKNIIANGW
ncbi:MAG: DUF2235 domain-containing protein [Bacteroidetes bacterium]|nr:DUF2235 domain-containing protein [Bacteroidota bacterium]